jgi:HEAT repeat protein
VLNPQAARDQVKLAYRADWIQRFEGDAAKLDPSLREIAYALVADTMLGWAHPDRRPTGDDLGRIVPRYEALAERERLRVLETVYPRLAAHVDRAWQLYRCLPYQIGATRRAYRAPHSTDVVQWARFSWLQRTAAVIAGYEQELAWFAAWAPYLPHWGAADALGVLLAGAIDRGEEEGQAVYEILVASARGEHAVGAMGRHVTRALLIASRPEGWDLVERLLLAAQRQEGLRQAILETVDEAHPEAFRRMLRLILDHDLIRFNATLRAADVWFGLEWKTDHTREARDTIAHALHYLDDPAARARALQGEDDRAAYVALWALAFEDAEAAVEPATRLLADSRVERRYVAAYLIGSLGLTTSRDALLPALEDADLRVVMLALDALRGYQAGGTDLFERLEHVLPRLPRGKHTLAPLVWPWLALTADRQATVGALVEGLGERSPKRLIPYLDAMSVDDRGRVARLLTQMRGQDTEVREVLLSLVGDRSAWVRKKALAALAKHRPSEAEAIGLEGLLTRQAGDLRRGVLSMLLNQNDAAALASAGRLLGASAARQRLAGLDLLRQMAEAGRMAGRCRDLAARFQASNQPLADDEAQLLSHILARSQEPPTLDDALGTIDPAERTPPVHPRGRSLLSRRRPLVTPAAIACLKALDALVHEGRALPLTITTWDGSEEEALLGNVTWGFPAPDPTLSLDENRPRLPLPERWERWYAERPPALRDGDGLELVRALGSCAAAGLHAPGPFGQPVLPEVQRALNELFAVDERGELRYHRLVDSVLRWLIYLHPAEGTVDCLLEAVEASLAALPGTPIEPVDLVAMAGANSADWRTAYSPYGVLQGWLNLARYHRLLCPTAWRDEHHVRLWGLVRWLDEPYPGAPRHRPPLEEALFAYHAGGASEADLLDHLMGPQPADPYGYFAHQELVMLSGFRPHPLIQVHPVLADLVERCRQRILEVELARGEMPTAASRPALRLRYAGGAATLFRVLGAMGPERLVRGWTYDSLSKASVFSSLIRATMPLEGDTLPDFRDRVRAAGIPERRLIELALYTPQWANHVEHALGWPGLADATWWVHAHTKDTNWQVGPEIRALWNAQISEYTPLSGEQLLDGAVDVEWFFRAYRALGSERWDRLYKNAEYASGGRGHKRAQLFADAMLGCVEAGDLVARIEDKRHQDSVRALGLYPLPKGAQEASLSPRGGHALSDSGAGTQDLLARYRVFQEFLRTGRKFGSQRQASERLAVQIGMENLARTAGYPDPVRLEWAIEAQETADLVGEGQAVRVGETRVTLSIDPMGQPQMSVEKAGRRLKRVPAALRKDQRVAALRERRGQLVRQASRMRRSLEGAMVRGDGFSPSELQALLAHPLLAPMLERLVLIGEGAIGYLSAGGTALEVCDGGSMPLAEGELLRVAHPYDLYRSGEWHRWQRDCYVDHRVQPFKQVYRELYLLTRTEREEGTVSHRYAGQQVNPRQALALFGQRGWVSYPEEGMRRTYHQAGISAWVTFAQGYFTPAEVGGLTLEGVSFVRRGEWQPLALAEVPPRLFSEAMRDLDLVVSVAHQGGVDPEASASTIEMRATLVRETCTMLHLDNVRVDGRYALIEGSLGSYNVHLGSAVIHQQPGGAICAVPVHAQHRGRLFLPFVDDDPKTAEVVSKVLLLAKDGEIRDPTILEQILH